MVSLERAQKRLAMSEPLKGYTVKLGRQTEECRLDLLEAQEELIKTERRATIGETVAVLAHCIKNVLTGLGGGMYMVQTGEGATFSVPPNPHMDDEHAGALFRGQKNTDI